MAQKPQSPPPTGPVQPGFNKESLQKEICSLREDLVRSRDAVTELRSELDELRHRASDGDKARTAVQQLSRELEMRTLKMEHEIQVARQFQRLFIPPVLPEFRGVRFAVKYQPSPRVGGDFYDLFDMGNGCIGILVADIAGYGLAATLITAVAKMAFDAFRQNEYSPHVIMDKVNDQVVRSTPDNQFLTAFLGVLDLETLKLKYVNASHPCPVLFGKERIKTLDAEGVCCGMFPDAVYEEREVQLHVGDRVALFTRGILKISGENGETLVQEVLQATPDIDLDGFVASFAEKCAKKSSAPEQTEDITIVAFEMLPREAPMERLVIPSDPTQISRVESLILSRLEEFNYGERALFGVRLALEEAVINAMKHGNRMDKARKVEIAYSVDARECVINITDEGEGFDLQAVPDPTADENLDLPHGRGLVLIRAYMDEVSYNERGNSVTIRKKAPWAS